MARERKKTVGTSNEGRTRQPIAPHNSGDATATRADRDRVATRAYELYISRGGQEGRALDDWLRAEREILQHAGAGDEG